MIYDGGRRRGYADTTADLAGLLIAGYDQLTDPQDRLRARIRYATDAHVPIQAEFAASVPQDLGACTPAQREVLLGTRDTPPAVSNWPAPVPLVLVTSFYAPAGERPRPAEDGGQIIWIDPATDDSLLTSLHDTGWIIVSRRTGPAGPGERGQ